MSRRHRLSHSSHDWFGRSVALSVALATAGHAAAGDDVQLLAHDLNSFVGYPVVAGERAFSAGAVWCNLSGDELAWDANTNQHPISVLNLYRIENGLLVQLGASWATHQFCALQLTNCGTCTPAGAGCPFALGSGCSTSSTASSLGFQANMSKRSDVDAVSAGFPFPFSNPAVGSLLERRCRVKLEEIDPALHPNATYFFELVTLHQSAGYADHRCVVRKVKNTTLLGTPLADGPSHEGVAAAEFWVNFVGDASQGPLEQPGDGRMTLSSHYLKLPDGTWRYDYTIQNINASDEAMRLSVPLGEGVSATNPFFHAPLAHSGEITSNEPWLVDVSPREITWTAPGAERGPDANPTANVVRWGTTYTFSFVSDRIPTVRHVAVKRFRSGDTNLVPVLAPKPPSTAASADLNNDGAVNAEDLAILLSVWGGSCAPYCPPDLSDDGTVNSADLAILLGYWTN